MNEKNNTLISYTSRRYPAFDLIKLVALLVVLIHHNTYRPDFFKRGYIVVDLFFIISGFLFMNSYIKDQSQDLTKHFIKKFRIIYPVYFLAWLATFTFQFIKLKAFPYKNDYTIITELLMLQNVIPTGGALNYPLWYISILFYTDLIHYFIIGKFKDKRKYLILTAAISIFFLAIQLATSLKLEKWGAWQHILPFPFIRGFAAFSLGVLVFFLSQKLQNIPKKVGFIFWIMEIISSLGICALLIIKGNFDFLIYPLALILVLSSSLPTSIVAKISDNKAIRTASKIQLEMFCIHGVALWSTAKLLKPLPFPRHAKLILSILFVIACAIALHYLAKALTFGIQKIRTKKS